MGRGGSGVLGKCYDGVAVLEGAVCWRKMLVWLCDDMVAIWCGEVSCDGIMVWYCARIDLVVVKVSSLSRTFFETVFYRFRNYLSPMLRGLYFSSHRLLKCISPFIVSAF